MPGAVCLPHGFGQRRDGVRLLATTLQERATTTAATTALDPLSG